MKMLMKCIASGKFVKTDLEAFKNKEIPTLWRLVDSEEEATNDPAFVGGEDLTMLLAMEMRDHYDCTEGLTCHVPKTEAVEEELGLEEALELEVERTNGKHRTLALGLGLVSFGSAMGPVLARASLKDSVELVDCTDTLEMPNEKFEDLWEEASGIINNTFIKAKETFVPKHELPRHARFSHRRPELAYGKQFNKKPRGRIR